MKCFISFFSLVIFSSLFKYNSNVFCREHCTDCNFGIVCISCEDHYYLTWTDTCKECDSVCKTCKGPSENCTSCYEGYYLSNKKCLICDSNCKECSIYANNCSSCF